MASTAAPTLPPGAFDDRSPTVIGVVVFCLLFSTAMVALRLYTRIVLIKQMGIDDYACIVGLLVTYGSGVAITHMTSNGLGKHIYGLDPTTIPALVPRYLRDFYVSIVFYCAALLAIKLTFLFQYYRVLAVQQMRIVYMVAIVIVGGWGLSQLLVGIFICTPIEGFWDSTVESTCIPNIPQWYINAAGNIITDIAVFLLPLPAIWKLNLVKQQKILLLGIFCLGFLQCYSTVVISMIRIRYLKLFDDFTWENVDSSLWSMGELSSAITCACLPTLRPLVSRYFPNLAIGTRAGRSSGKNGYYAKTDEATGGGSKFRDPEASAHGQASKIASSSAADSEIELALGRDASHDGAASVGSSNEGSPKHRRADRD
ncbi:putative integral membrane protein [Apodospora peruviana]|uniref:Integral membrane protein n=1 Tax=Apodospora peruviana TaxID=516989 RepID=A0AAE0ID53_9PEZI|nr:putative integral membrane protein [Apodospora peruviana]